MLRIPLYAFALALACVVAVCAAQSAHARAKSGLDAAERGVVDAINRMRAGHGLPRLQASASLSRAADQHTCDMVARGLFTHTSSNGRSAASRVKGFAHAREVGETLAYVSVAANDQAAQVVALWMRSAGHRRVLLSRRFARIGVARRAGNLSGDRVSVFTADFASRR